MQINENFSFSRNLIYRFKDAQKAVTQIYALVTLIAEVEMQIKTQDVFCKWN